jgi:hypothetical protein
MPATLERFARCHARQICALVPGIGWTDAAAIACEWIEKHAACRLWSADADGAGQVIPAALEHARREVARRSEHPRFLHDLCLISDLEIDMAHGEIQSDKYGHYYPSGTLNCWGKATPAGWAWYSTGEMSLN